MLRAFNNIGAFHYAIHSKHYQPLALFDHGYHSHIQHITVAIEINLRLQILQNSSYHMLIIIERRSRMTNDLVVCVSADVALRCPVSSVPETGQSDSVGNLHTKMFHTVCPASPPAPTNIGVIAVIVS